METCSPLSIESFSYSWLVNLKPSLDSLDNSLRASFDASDEASFIEMDPRMPPSKRFLIRNSLDLKFDFPTSSQSPLTLLHADELFCNGYVMPLFLKQLNIDNIDADEASDDSSTIPKMPEEKSAIRSSKLRCSSLRRCRRLSKQMFLKYLDFIRPLCRKIRGRRSSSIPENVDKRVKKNRVYSAGTSPRISMAYSADDWRRSCDSDCSINEAVLHCKRSIGK
ncbi:hypothetical protein HS088_TW08G00073 [Tripterygium wilfordii]|uniref:Membrane-associated kinase regulator 6 n=1 Tax=Tripterygium wilfordii TaxID=458696 RepID=A0A7J7DB53_TRIWF|nr:probable membrane-associated kinase regulator 6 [Tripterygium wilfordii]XP_038709756.1 probable membrane-associated kinase regulator 6 [Tripterygium wilfordii]KAF5743489.1 hypothetical protein HS088_TW08G00073 [Tripterygium wilfordii]